jgi:uncharacterized protein (TIGR03000 family)
MFKQLLGATFALLLGTGSVLAQHGGGGGGGGGHGGGGAWGGGHGGVGYGRGYGYNRGFYGGFGFGGVGVWGFGYPYPYPYFGGAYDLGGMGYSSFGGYGSGGYGSYGGAPIVPYSPEYTPTPIPPANFDPTTPPALPAPLPPPTRQAPSGTMVSTAVATAATVTVIVPEGGQVWFDNTLTPATESKWVYTSPKLEPGKTYTVNVKARWADGSQDRDYNIPLRITAGDKMTMDLTKVR